MVEPQPDTTARLEVNGVTHTVVVSVNDTLADLLRERLRMTSCRESCGIGVCGSCTVLVDERAVSACIFPAFNVDGTQVRTAEGLEQGTRLNALQQAFIEEQAFQCSYCTPGFLMSATAALAEDCDRVDVADRATEGHLCRCGSIPEIKKAIAQLVDGRTDLSS